MNIISRKQAQALGMEHYYTGEPCIRGHLVKRYTSNRACFSCHNNEKNRAIQRNLLRKKRKNAKYRLKENKANALRMRVRRRQRAKISRIITAEAEL